MNYININIRGLPVEDAFIYGTSLYAWTFDSDLLIIPVDEIEASIRSALNHEAILADGVCFLLFHSNHVGARQSQYVAAAHLSMKSRSIEIEIDASKIRHSVLRTSLDADCLTDVMVYFNRMHLSTDEGLFELELPRGVDDVPKEIHLERTLPYPCYSSVASLGALATSCGDEGLIVTFNNYDWYGPAKRRRVVAAGQSRRSTYGSGGLFNFTASDSYQYLSGEIWESNANRDDRGTALLVDLEPGHIVDGAFHNQLSRDEIDYVLFARRKLIFLADGDIFGVHLSKVPEGRKLSRKRHLLGQYDRSPISISANRSMLMIESDDDIVVCGRNGANDEVEFTMMHWNCGPTIALRTFPMSRRYLDLAVRTSETGIDLFTVISTP